MTDDGQMTDILSRLRRLDRDTGDLVADAIEPIDQILAEIGVTFRASHFAEDCRDWSGEAACYQAHASRFVFAIEATEGRATEYSLCAAPGPDGRHGLYVSVCEYHTEGEHTEDADGTVLSEPQVVIDGIYTVRPESLSLDLRSQMLDELEQGHFLRALADLIREHDGKPPAEAMNRYWLPGTDS
jgi:hypothetical protein